MRGLQWFNALSAGATPVTGLPDSLKVADGVLGGQAVRFIAVVPDAHNRFPRARNGEVGLLDIVLGQSVSTGQKIGQINDLSDYKVEAQIDESYIDRVRAGLEATFDRQGTDYKVRLRKVYPEVRSGQFRADFTFLGDHPENIRSGQTYYLHLELGQPTEAVIIPRGSFYQTTGGAWIYVLAPEGDKAYKRPIRIGRQNPQYYEVLDGLEPGERVAILVPPGHIVLYSAI